MVPYNGDHSLTFFLLGYFVGRVEFQLIPTPHARIARLALDIKSLTFASRSPAFAVKALFFVQLLKGNCLSATDDGLTFLLMVSGWAKKDALPW